MSETNLEAPTGLVQQTTVRIVNTLGLIGGFGAFLAGSCCVLPLAFVSLGLGGTWLASLDSLLAYRQELQFAAIVILGLGWVTYLRRQWQQKTTCTTQTCASMTSRLQTPLLLSLGTLFVFGSWLVWETQGDIRSWIFEMRTLLDG